MRRTAVALLAAAALWPASCGDDSGTATAGDESAGSWRTWVLGSATETPLPTPPVVLPAGDTRRAQRALDRPAVQPWLEQAMTLVSRRPKDPVTASRNYALVAVAMYDAAVAAERAKTSTRAAIAGAASRVIAHLFPEHPAAQLEADAERVAGDLLSAGKASGEQGASGLELGRRVATKVIDVARHDGSDRVWKGRLPNTRAAWRPPPGSSARPVAPLAGTWRTWVLRDGSEVRPPPPPAYESREFKREVERVLDTDVRLTAEQKRIAEFWAGGEGTELPPGRWLKVVLAYLRDRPAMSDARTARAFALVAVAMADAGVAAWDAKYAYWVTRPVNAVRDLGLAKNWKPHLDTPFFPAYVSGHATYSAAAAEVLAYLFPEDAKLWHSRAEEAAASRVYGGIHYWMDGDQGLRMGREIGRRVVARAKRDGADA